ANNVVWSSPLSARSARQPKVGWCRARSGRSASIASTRSRGRAVVPTLLAELSRTVPQPKRDPRPPGRNRALFSDAVFAATFFKIYATLSSRRFTCDLKDAYARGHVTKPILFNILNAYLQRAELTPILHTLIGRSALPLKAVETPFAVDSSGFSSSKFVRWYDEKYGIPR